MTHWGITRHICKNSFAVRGNYSHKGHFLVIQKMRARQINIIYITMTAFVLNKILLPGAPLSNGGNFLQILQLVRPRLEKLLGGLTQPKWNPTSGFQQPSPEAALAYTKIHPSPPVPPFLPSRNLNL